MECILFLVEILHVKFFSTRYAKLAVKLQSVFNSSDVLADTYAFYFIQSMLSSFDRNLKLYQFPLSARISIEKSNRDRLY